MSDAQRVDVERLRAVMALLNQGAMLNEAGEPCAAGHFFGKYQTEAADFLRDNAEGIAALLLQVAEYRQQNAIQAAAIESKRTLLASAESALEDAWAKLAAQAAEIERLNTECKDRIRQALENGQAFHAAERAREESIAVLTTIRDSTFRSAIQLRSMADRFLAANGGQNA